MTKIDATPLEASVSDNTPDKARIRVQDRITKINDEPLLSTSFRVALENLARRQSLVRSLCFRRLERRIVPYAQRDDMSFRAVEH